MSARRPFSDKEVLMIADKLKENKRNYALFLLGIYTGFRIKELLSVRVKDVVLPNGKIANQLVIRAQDMKGRQGHKKSRAVVLSESVKDALREWVNELGDGEFLFQSREGGAISTRQARRIIQDACAELGIFERIGTHSMRKTYGNKIHKLLGNDIFATMQALGHTNVRNTQYYLEIGRERINQATQSISFG